MSKRIKSFLKLAGISVICLSFYLVNLHVNVEAAVLTTDLTGDQERYVSDDWSYRSSSKSITIKKVVRGKGSELSTCFVADILLRDADDLGTALYNNKLGKDYVETTSKIAKANNAIFAVNGDYCGYRDTGIVIRNGVKYRDVAKREGLAFYEDGSMKTFDEITTSANELLSQNVRHTLSFGPVLVKDSKAKVFDYNVYIDEPKEGDVEIEEPPIDPATGLPPAGWTPPTLPPGAFPRIPIQSANPRTGIGYYSPNHYCIVVVDGRKPGYSKGLTLTEFAEFFQELGCTDAYNLDGGGSSTMYFMGKIINSPWQGERETSDIVYIK